MEKTKAELDLERRIMQVRQWPDMEKRLREEKNIKRAGLCRKYGIDESVFSKAANLKTIPRQKTIDRINAAFAAEGIE